MGKLLLDNIATVAGIVSAAFAAIALLASWQSVRRAELRRDDVLGWANEAIAALQTVRLLTGGSVPADEAGIRAKLAALMFDTSILVERGRLFFRNTAQRRHGQDKPHAYRGKRPEILDQLVLAHQIACAWPSAEATERQRMGVVAEDVLRRFVSLVQMEVGRVRTVSADTRRRGDGADLKARLLELERTEG